MLVRTDNTTAMAHISHQGRTQSTVSIQRIQPPPPLSSTSPKLYLNPTLGRPPEHNSGLARQNRAVPRGMCSTSRSLSSSPALVWLPNQVSPLLAIMVTATSSSCSTKAALKDICAHMGTPLVLCPQLQTEYSRGNLHRWVLQQFLLNALTLQVSFLSRIIRL